MVTGLEQGDSHVLVCSIAQKILGSFSLARPEAATATYSGASLDPTPPHTPKPNVEVQISECYGENIGRSEGSG